MPKSAKRKERRQEQKASYLAGRSRKSYKHRSALNVGLDEDDRQMGNPRQGQTLDICALSAGRYSQDMKASIKA